MNLDRFLGDRRVVWHRSADTGAVRRILLGGFLLTTGSVFLLVFTTGYVVRVTRESAGGSGEPVDFDDWWRLLAEGLAGYVVWTVYSLPALVVLVPFANVYYASTNELATPWSQEFLTASVSLLGTALGGSGGFARDLLRIAQNVGVATGTIPPPTFLGPPRTVDGYLLVAYGLALFASLYLTPAAIANYATAGRLRSGFALREILRSVAGRRYLRSWLLAASMWLLGSLLFIGWNAWRVTVEASDWTTVPIGFIPLVRVPTGTGAVSTTVLLAAGVAAFYLLVAGYSVVGSTWGAIRDAGAG